MLMNVDRKQVRIPYYVIVGYLTLNLHLFIIINFLCGFVQPSNFALLSGTLKKFEINACDGDPAIVKCPNGTLISIVGAKYGRSTSPDYLCLPRTTEESRHFGDITIKCNTSSAFLYDVLQRTVNACQEQQTCKLLASPRTFGGDPCPGLRKLATVEHRCRPSYFKRKVICEGETMKLRCPRGKRLAIYSAEFGRKQKDKVLECPLPDELANKQIKDCQASYATEMLLRSCHGQRRCNVAASTQTFGNPCERQPLVNMYLRVEFTCVPKQILKDEFKSDGNGDEGTSEEDIIRKYFHPSDQPPIPSVTVDHAEVTRFPAMRPTNDTDMQSDETGEDTNNSSRSSSANSTDDVLISSGEYRVVGFVTEWISAYSFIKDNQEKFILYLTLSIAAGILMLLIVLSLRLYTQKRNRTKHAKMNISDPVPSAFTDNNSELEHFGSEYTDNPDSVEALRYTNRSTIRRQESDNRTPVSMSLNNYYYS